MGGFGHVNKARVGMVPIFLCDGKSNGHETYSNTQPQSFWQNVELLSQPSC